MAYRFQRNERIGDGVERMLRERIDASIEALDGPADTLDRGIHEARKNFKKSRSLLRLIRPNIADDHFHDANRFFRSAGLRLSDARDAKVMLDTVGQLRTHFPKRFQRLGLLALQNDMSMTLSTALSAHGVQHDALQSQAKALVANLRNPPDFGWCRTMDSHQFALLSKGFRRAHKGGRKAMARARSSHEPESFHDWRKRAKDQWYQTLLLRDCWPEFMCKRRRQLKLLAESLGDYNDLSVLQAWCLVDQNRCRDERYGKLVQLAQQRQHELRKKLLQSGQRLYTQTPNTLDRAVAKHWKRWKRNPS